jgi:excisionase family DNA binding protein
MNCIKCKTSLPDASKFCLSCGSEQPKPEPVKPEVEDAVLTIDETAKMLKVSRWKFYEAIRTGNAPPHFTLGAHKRFLRSAVLKWAEEQSGISFSVPR